MKSKYETLDRSRLIVKPLAERKHDLPLEHWMALDAAASAFEHPELGEIARRLKTARDKSAARILMMGAHVIRAGVNRHIIDLIERGAIDHIALNGAGANCPRTRRRWLGTCASIAGACARTWKLHCCSSPTEATGC